jgi:hypothetical protein
MIKLPIDSVRLSNDKLKNRFIRSTSSVILLTKCMIPYMEVYKGDKLIDMRYIKGYQLWMENINCGYIFECLKDFKCTDASLLSGTAKSSNDKYTVTKKQDVICIEGSRYSMVLASKVELDLT